MRSSETLMKVTYVEDHREEFEHVNVNRLIEYLPRAGILTINLEGFDDLRATPRRVMSVRDRTKPLGKEARGRIVDHATMAVEETLKEIASDTVNDTKTWAPLRKVSLYITSLTDEEFLRKVLVGIYKDLLGPISMYNLEEKCAVRVVVGPRGGAVNMPDRDKHEVYNELGEETNEMVRCLIGTVIRETIKKRRGVGTVEVNLASLRFGDRVFVYFCKELSDSMFSDGGVRLKQAVRSGELVLPTATNPAPWGGEGPREYPKDVHKEAKEILLDGHRVGERLKVLLGKDIDEAKRKRYEDERKERKRKEEEEKKKKNERARILKAANQAVGTITTARAASAAMVEDESEEEEEEEDIIKVYSPSKRIDLTQDACMHCTSCGKHKA